MVRKSILLLAAALFTLPLFAANLGLYKEWSDSPAAYFLTSAERTEWATLQTEADAAQFVQKFTAARGGEKFTAELKKRIAMADKYLTVGSTPGSQTTRGKIIIVLGPPTSMDVSVKPAKGHTTAAPASMGAPGAALSNGTTVSEANEAAQRDAMTAGTSSTKIYTFTYANLTVPVEVNVSTGKDKIRDKKAAEELDRRIEETARASIVVK